MSDGDNVSWQQLRDQFASGDYGFDLLPRVWPWYQLVPLWEDPASDATGVRNQIQARASELGRPYSIDGTIAKLPELDRSEVQALSDWLASQSFSGIERLRSAAAAELARTAAGPPTTPTEIDPDGALQQGSANDPIQSAPEDWDDPKHVDPLEPPDGTPPLPD